MPTRGTTGCRITKCACGYFNPRAHEGHDTNSSYLRQVSLISIHVPTRGTTVKISSLITSSLFQSTCPRGARRTRDIEYLYVYISIHVPTRGTTCSGFGALLLQYFNPRAHEGHDLLCGRLSLIFGFQSTCPRGARLNTMMNVKKNVHFNPRAHEGHDRHTDDRNIRRLRFQSTCPRGARQKYWAESSDDGNFNPRAHEGHDSFCHNCHSYVGISIHVPTRGTTHYVGCCRILGISIHVPTRGTTTFDRIRI